MDDVAVVGGGIGGLTAALALHRQGIACTVYEQAPEIREIGAGVGLWPATFAVFDRLGIGQDVRALGGQWSVGGIRKSTGEYLMRWTAERFRDRIGTMMGVHRGELQAVLLRNLPDVKIVTGRRCTNVDVGPGRVDLTFDDGTVARTRAVVAADGRRSVIRTALFGAKELRDTHSIGWRGTAVVPPGANWSEFSGEVWGRGGRFGLVPIAGGRVTWYAGCRLPCPSTKEEALRRFGDWFDPIGAIIEATPDENIWVDRIDDLWPLRRWTVGPVTLLGDAAHPMTPDLGLGACQAIIDAEVLARCVAERSSVEEAFAAYEKARRRRTTSVVLAARVATAGGTPDRGWFAALRATVFSVMPDGLMLRQMRGLGIR